MTLKDKSFLLALMILLLVSGYLFIGYYFPPKLQPVPVNRIEPQPTTTVQVVETPVNSAYPQTSGWQLEKNSEMGYELEVPGKFLTYYYNGKKSLVIRQHECELECPSIFINVSYNPQGLTAQEYYSKDLRDDVFMRSEGYYKKVQVSGREAFELSPYITLGGEIDNIIPYGPLFIEIFDSVLSPDDHNRLVSSFKIFGDPEQVVSKHFGYEVEYGGQYGQEMDGELVYYNEEGRRIVLVSSLREAIPEIKAEPELSLHLLSRPVGSEKLFFEIFLDGSDAPKCCLYSFDLSTKTFFRLKVGDYFINKKVITPISPDGTRFVFVDGQKLYVANLETDKFAVVLELTSTETLVSEYDDFSAQFHTTHLLWLNDHQIEYGVYHGKDLANFDPQDSNRQRLPLIEKRQVSI